MSEITASFCASHDWCEDDFVQAFEECRYPNQSFKHADHIRLAWIYLRKYGPITGEERICASIRRFAASLGHEQKYHETMTRAWFRLVSSAHCEAQDIASFDEFLARFPSLFDRRLLSEFYSDALMAAEKARSGWVEPDRLRELVLKGTSASSI